MTNQGIEILKVVDTKDDRKEIFYLLTLLSLQERTAFLTYIVREINRGIVFTHEPPWSFISVQVEHGTAQEAYMDLMLATAKYQIPVSAVLQDLADFVRKKSKYPTEDQRMKALHHKHLGIR